MFVFVSMYVYMEGLCMYVCRGSPLLNRAVREHHIGDPQEGGNVSSRVQISSGIELLMTEINVCVRMYVCCMYVCGL